jgi:uncharacterized protein
MKHIWPITIIEEPVVKEDVKSLRTDIYETLKADNGRVFLLAIESACFAEISSEAAEFLTNLKVNKATYIPRDSEISEELYSLYKKGFFEKRYFHDDIKNCEVNTLNLNITTHCNLSCRYCFAEEGTYGMEHKKVSIDSIKSAIKKLIKAESPQKNYTIVLFGGEPLTEPGIVKDTINFCKRCSMDYGISLYLDIFTNATLIPDWLFDEFENNKHLRFLISIDGTPELNEYYRKSTSGIIYTDILEANIRKLTTLDSKRVVIRSTVSIKKADIISNIEYFVGLGAKNIVFESALCKGIPTIDNADEIYEGLYNELENVKKTLKEHILNKSLVNINLISETTALILGKNRVNSIPECPAGKSYLSVSIDGDIYPCHYLNCNKDFKIGNLDVDGLKQRDVLRENLFESLDKNKVICNTCIYRFICSGLCPYKSLVMYRKDDKFINASCKLWDGRIRKSLELLTEIYAEHNYPAVQYWSNREENKYEL